MHNERLRKLREKLAEHNFDALLVTEIHNIFYLSGFTGSTAALLVTGNSSHILVDPRYTTQAKGECPSAEVIEYRGKSTIAAAAELINEIKPAVTGFEADDITVISHRDLRNLTNTGIKYRTTKGLVQELRSIKDEHEIRLIRDAVQIADATYDFLLKNLVTGIPEYDAALLVDSTLRRLGADKEAFETIAASGPNAACPHASPTDAIITTGQMLKLDYGARLNKYNSDITRTVFFGKASDKYKEVYSIVLDAQIKAIEAIAPGKTGREIDAVARDYITSMGYGDNFGHGLGHALGIEVHDGPAFSKMSDIVLKPGMVATVEPGIYIEGWGGVRIEDDVLVTETGVEIITKATKELICL